MGITLNIGPCTPMILCDLLNRSSSRVKVADAASVKAESELAEAPVTFKCDAWKHFGFPVSGDENV